MPVRLRLLVPLALACAAFLLALVPAPAVALPAAFAAPELLYGTVVSLEARVIPETGVIVTDVRMIGGRFGGGKGLTRFTMQGGEVGGVGMWSEQYRKMRVGDSVVARVAERNGELAAMAAPMVEGAVADSTSDVGSASAATVSGYTWEGLHWADDSLPVSFRVNPAGLPTGAAASIAAAAQTWEDDPGSYLDVTYAGSTATASSAGRDGVNVVGSGSLGNSSTIAQCSYWYWSSTDEVFEFDITYNTGTYSFATNGSASAYDIQGIGTHELGHALVLADLYDAQDAAQVMYGYGYKGDTSQRTLGTGDVAGIRAIYPIAAANTAPVAVSDAATVAEDGVLTAAAPGVLANDTDAEGNTLTAGLVAGVSHGTLTLASNGSYTYRPSADYSGSDSFTYRAHDGTAYSNTVTVSISVTAVNDAPIVVANSYAVAADAVLSASAPGVLANDTDAEGASLSASLVTGVSHGTLSLAANGSFTYTPSAGYSGSDSFSYRASDGSALSGAATVSISVSAGNQAPIAPEDVTPPITTADRVAYYATSARIVLAAVDGPEGSGVAHTYYALNGAPVSEGGTVTVSSEGSYSLAYRSVDAAGNAEATTTVTFTVIAKPSSSGTPSRPAAIAALRHGTTFPVSGYMVRRTAGTYPVTLQFYRYQSGHWVLRKSTTAKASNILTFSKYSRSTSVPYSGKWRVRARHKIGSTYRYSTYRYFTAS